MATTIDRVMEEINTLSSDERLRLVNRIVETLIPSSPVLADNNNVVHHNLRGKYRNSIRPSDAFSQNKSEEQKLEDRGI